MERQQLIVVAEVLSKFSAAVDAYRIIRRFIRCFIRDLFRDSKLLENAPRSKKFWVLLHPYLAECNTLGQLRNEIVELYTNLLSTSLKFSHSLINFGRLRSILLTLVDFD